MQESKLNKKADQRRVRRRYPFSVYKSIGIHASFPGLLDIHSFRFSLHFVSFQSSFRIISVHLFLFVCTQRGTARAKLPEAIGLHITVCFISYYLHRPPYFSMSTLECFDVHLCFYLCRFFLLARALHVLSGTSPTTPPSDASAR